MTADDLSGALERLEAATAAAGPGVARLRRLERDLQGEAAAPEL